VLCLQLHTNDAYSSVGSQGVLTVAIDFSIYGDVDLTYHAQAVSMRSLRIGFLKYIIVDNMYTGCVPNTQTGTCNRKNVPKIERLR